MSIRSRVAALIAPPVEQHTPAAAFAVKPTATALGPTSLPGAAFFDLTSDRASAIASDLCMALPAVRAAVLAITGPISTWPLYLEDATGTRLPTTDARAAWITNPEPGRALGWLLAATITDGIWHRYSVWKIADRTAFGAIIATERIHPNRWQAHPDSRDPDRIASWTIDGTPTDPSRLVVFDFSHLGGVRRIGWPLLSLYSDLMAAAANYARSPLPSEILRNTGDDLEDNEVDDLLDAWEQARRARGPAYLNASVEHSTVGWNAKEMQLLEAREQITTEVARFFGLPTFAVSAKSADSMTYNTVVERRRDYQQAISPWSQVITDTLTAAHSSGTATGRPAAGLKVRQDSSDFTRPDAAERMNTWEVGLRSGVLDLADAKAAEPLSRNAR